MPSPFPGMDPFLESPDWFPDLHHGLIFTMQAALQACLPRMYYARSRQRVWLDLGHQSHEPYLGIHRRQATDDVVVAVIEILSPSSKTRGDHGRSVYVAKQQETLLSPAHLIEIDLLRGGAHTTAVPLDFALDCIGSFEYHVCVHRSDQSKEFAVYPIKLESKLPAIAVPLLSGDPDVALDLQAVFDRAYDEGPYERAVRYDMANIEPALRPEQAEWVKFRLAVERD